MEIRYSIVIPVYNSKNTLDELYLRLVTVLEELSGGLFEILFIDDCSKDASFGKLKELQRRDGRVKVVRLSRNYGQQNALLCGFHYARGKIVITLDDDLQHPPEEIPKLVAALQDGFDAIFGIPAAKQHPRYRKWGSLLIDCLMRGFCAKPSRVRVSSFRAIRREVVAAVVKMKKTGFIYLAPLIFTVAHNPGNVTIRHEPRKYGRSNYTLWKLVRLTILLVANYSWIAKFKPPGMRPSFEIAETLFNTHDHPNNPSR